MEEILLQEECIRRIEPAEEWKIPEINYTALFPTSDNVVSENVEWIKDYLNSYYIIDSFPNHDERTEWRKKFKTKYPKVAESFINNDCLKGNSIFIVRSGLRAMLDFGSEDLSSQAQERIEQTRQYVQDLFERYDRIGDSEKKLPYVRGMKTKFFELLCYLSGESFKQK